MSGGGGAGGTGVDHSDPASGPTQHESSTQTGRSAAHSSFCSRLMSVSPGQVSIGSKAGDVEISRHVVEIKGTLDSIGKTHGNGAWKNKILINDRIADSIFQQIIIRPADYSILATTNLNGDYISDAAAAQVGGLGIAPGANIGDGYAVFEATHGTAPKYADKDVINPGSVILSGVMLLDFIGWKEAAKMIENAMEKTILQKFVTYDFERQTAGATKVGTSEFATRIIGNM